MFAKRVAVDWTLTLITPLNAHTARHKITSKSHHSDSSERKLHRNVHLKNVPQRQAFFQVTREFGISRELQVVCYCMQQFGTTARSLSCQEFYAISFDQPSHSWCWSTEDEVSYAWRANTVSCTYTCWWGLSTTLCRITYKNDCSKNKCSHRSWTSTAQWQVFGWSFHATWPCSRTSTASTILYILTTIYRTEM